MRLSDVVVSPDLMSHAVRVTDIADRKAFFAGLAKGQRVLHVGCCDVPVFNPDTNLHVALAGHTRMLDGLDVSVPGIEVLRRHVGGEYFTSAEQVNKDYDLVLVPEVLEHTRSPEDFLEGIFSIVARRYVITAPSFEWFREARRDGNLFIEKVHGDHKAWYSPYTLVNTVRPFIDPEADDVEVYSIQGMGSVAIRVDKMRDVRPWPETKSQAGSREELESFAKDLCDQGLLGQALDLLRDAYDDTNDLRFAYQEIGLRLGLAQNLEALRRSVEVMRMHPEQCQLLYFAAEASERLGDAGQAEELRNLARAREGGR